MHHADAPAPERFLRIVADPHRWTLLRELARSDRRVGELTALVGRPQNLVSYHLGVLRSGGLVRSRRSNADGRDTYYRLDLGRCRGAFADAGHALHPGIHLVPGTPSPAPAAENDRPRVLFVCTGNSARSPIAEAILAQRSGGAVHVASAGTQPKPIHPAAVRALAARGIDIAGRAPVDVHQLGSARFDRVITLCDRAREVCPELPGHPATAHWSIPDPATSTSTSTSTDGDPTAVFEQVTTELEERIEFLLAELIGTDPRKDPS